VTTLTSRNVPILEASDAADIPARVNPLAQLFHDRPGVSALTTTQRNALTGAELWDGRVILNTTTDRLNRYDLGTTTWVAIADSSEIAALLATSGTPAALGTASRGVSAFAARADHIHPEPTWTTYTPTWTGSGGVQPSLGNGTLTGRWIANGKLVDAKLRFVAGSTTTYGDGFFRFSLPVAAAAPAAYPVPLAGWSQATDVSASAGYMLFPRMNTSTTVFDLVYHAISANGLAYSAIGATFPFTWASGDFFDVHLSYERA
jgi:hypothetical protein